MTDCKRCSPGQLCDVLSAALLPSEPSYSMDGKTNTDLSLRSLWSSKNKANASNALRRSCCTYLLRTCARLFSSRWVLLCGFSWDHSSESTEFCVTTADTE